MSETAKTFSITLPVSGEVVTLRRPKQSKSSLALNLRRRYPKPTPPVMEVKVLGKVERYENYSHPDYLKAVAGWNSDMGLKINEMLLKLALVPPPKEELAAAVADTRALFPDVTEGQTDLEVWIDYVLCQDEEDFIALQGAVAQATGATEAQISDAIATFRADT